MESLFDVKFRQVHFFGTDILWLFEFASCFFHFKAHCWSGVWTENSEKNFQVLSWVAPNHRVTFRWVFSSASLQIAYFMTFLRIRIAFFHFKAHCWSGVWTENSNKKIPDVLLSTPNYRINFRWIPLKRTSLIAFCTNETFPNHVLSI